MPARVKGARAGTTTTGTGRRQEYAGGAISATGSISLARHDWSKKGASGL
jgi:hypothetical protein